MDVQEMIWELGPRLSDRELLALAAHLRAKLAACEGGAHEHPAEPAGASAAGGEAGHGTQHNNTTGGKP